MSERMPATPIDTGKPSAWSGDCLVIGVCEGNKPQEALKLCGQGVEEIVHTALAAKWLHGKAGESLLLPMPAGGASGARALLLIGLGKRDEITRERLRGIGGTIFAQARKSTLSTLLCLIPLDRQGLKRSVAAAALAEGVLLGSYRFDHYRQESPENERFQPQSFTLAVRKEDAAAVDERLKRVRAVVDGVFLARDLGNHPANVVNPDYLANQARLLGERHDLRTTIFGIDELQAAGMNGILAVGQGSRNHPRLITLEYRNGGDKSPLVVVGKAITFDAGGISLKPAEKMENMKYDMSGGAAVFGFLQAVATMRLPINVVGIVPAAENLPSGTAQRPGDIIRTAKGVCVEVINTDAEGRLILADALHHAERFQPRYLIDLATLTGACVVALGVECAGLLGNDKRLMRRLQRVGEESGERLWPLPMFPEYQEHIKSDFADIKNAGTRDAGTIMGGCFLSRFVEKGRPWAHLDIAGTAQEKTGRPHVPKGGSGFGVRLLCAFARKHMMD
ncbi:MAG: leucyl aminopeptidase [Magnetococcales bacterium]|nr:leucyl aminopeptidase [Magnetococcales bacterium]